MFHATAKNLPVKKHILFITALFFSAISFSQEVSLTDSIIYFDKTPVALYHKTLSNSTPRYNIDIYNFSKDTLITATVIKFDAPVDNLKAFYYYELVFPSIADTFSIYVEDEAFPLVLGKMVRDYKLIVNNSIDKNSVGQLKQSYPGGPALTAKVKAVEDYLNETRNYYEQAERDRTKPVSISNGGNIMQDDKTIGRIRETELPGNSRGWDEMSLQAGFTKDVVPFVGERPRPKELEISFENGRIIDLDRFSSKYFDGMRKQDRGYKLYQASRKKITPGSYEDHRLKRICFLIEEYAL